MPSWMTCVMSQLLWRRPFEAVASLKHPGVYIRVTKVQGLGDTVLRLITAHIRMYAEQVRTRFSGKCFFRGLDAARLISCMLFVWGLLA